MLRCAALLVLILGCGRLRFAGDGAADAADPPADTSDPADSGPVDGAIDTPGAPVDGRLSYRDAVLADGPVGYWRMGDAGSAVRDETGNHDGATTGSCTRGAPGALTGDSDHALEFDGINCQVTIGNFFAFPANAPYTVEAWASPHAIGNTMHIFTKQTRSGGGPVDGYALLVTASGSRWERTVATDNVTPLDIPIAAAMYSHLVGVYDGSALVMYVDGIAGTPKPNPVPMTSFSAAVFIGATSEGKFFDGLIDEVAVYDKVLAADRIQLHHRIGMAGP
jgi:hypothetical protein